MRTSRAVSLILLLAAAWAHADNPPSMRVDYYHSGNAGSEMFSLDRVVLEPLAFSGNLAQPIDETLRGKYAFEIVLPDGRIAWSRSFSSIYGEWETTAEARAMNRTFHESVRFPAPSEEFVLLRVQRAAEHANAQHVADRHDRGNADRGQGHARLAEDGRRCGERDIGVGPDQALEQTGVGGGAEGELRGDRASAQYR